MLKRTFAKILMISIVTVHLGTIQRQVTISGVFETVDLCVFQFQPGSKINTNKMYI